MGEETPAGKGEVAAGNGGSAQMEARDLGL